MDANKLVLGSLAMDLHRVALGYQRGSLKMAETFFKEALKRKGEVDQDLVEPYIKKLLSDFPKIIHGKDHQKIAEDALMYSTLLQNAALK